MTSSSPRLIGISGSLRKDSFNTAVLRTLADHVAAKATLVLHPLNDVPPYDQDLDTPEPPAGVAALRRAIADADGVVICAAEYNYGMSGVLKNALDWASRPFGQSAVTGRPVLTLTTSPAFTGGARAQTQLTETLIAMGARIVLRPQTVIATVHEKIVEGRLVDERSLNFIAGGVDDLLRDIRLRVATPRQES